MPAQNVFSWPEGRGWLILSGGVDADDEVRAQALGRAVADGGVAYVVLSSSAETAERVLEDMEELGAPSGYLVDVNAEDDRTLHDKLADAGMIVIESGASAVDVRSALRGAAIEGIQAAYENGAVVLAEGLSAMAFGAWVVRGDGGLEGGLEWLDGSLVAPGVTQTADWARGMLEAQPSAFAVGIGLGSALALGPDGQVETWGKREITIALGPAYVGSTGAQSI
jgi:hypothetical protein